MYIAQWFICVYTHTHTHTHTHIYIMENNNFPIYIGKYIYNGK